MPIIYQLTDRPSSIFDRYYHPTLAPYCYYDRPWLLCLQLIDHLLLYLQPTDLYCSASSNNRI